jgi:hypothetical protein
MPALHTAGYSHAPYGYDNRTLVLRSVQHSFELSVEWIFVLVTSVTGSSHELEEIIANVMFCAYDGNL